MATKDVILEILERNKGKSVSGGKLAETLNLSRNAVWKAVRALRNEGYLLDASPKNGYRLSAENVKLSGQSISRFLRDSGFYRISVTDSVASTNSVIKKLAENGEAEGFALTANEQTAGKGRMGRTFYSPPGNGIYLSILLRPKIPASDALLITTAAAVAVAKAIEETAGVSSQIKWVNDIYCSGKKVCGILTEASLDFESGGIDYAALGIGINMRDPDGGFPDEIKSSAGSVYGDALYPPDTKPRLIAAVLNNFLGYYKELPQKRFMNEYRERSCVIGKEIYVISANSREEALALGIDDDAALTAKFPDGGIRRLISGEITIREKRQ